MHRSPPFPPLTTHFRPYFFCRPQDDSSFTYKRNSSHNRIKRVPCLWVEFWQTSSKILHDQYLRKKPNISDLSETKRIYLRFCSIICNRRSCCCQALILNRWELRFSRFGCGLWQNSVTSKSKDPELSSKNVNASASKRLSNHFRLVGGVRGGRWVDKRQS
jgi:hypothetical protein